MLGDPAVQNLRGYDTKTGQKKWETSLKFDAPNRDPGARYLPGALYEDTVVVAVSTKVNPFVQQPGPNPEYIRLLGIEIATGKIKWDFITEPAQAGADFRQGGVVYGTKTIVIEGPNLSTYAIDGKTGAPLWKAFGVYLIPSSEPDSLYRLAPQSQNQAHTPIVQKLDINNGGKLLWTRGLPITVNNDPPIAVSPDEKTAYASVFTVSQQGQKSYLWTFTESGQIRQIETTAYGFYSMLPTNEGVYLIQSSPQASGIVYFDLTKDTPAWAVGGALELVFGPQLSPEDSFYTVFGDEKNNGYLFNINKKTGQVISTNAIEMPTAPLYFSPSQKVVYAVSGTTKPTVYAYARP
jgi:outer membrane protein assembly factor BamB